MGEAYWRLSAAEQAALVRSKRVTAVAIAEDGLARLEAVNPAINAVVDVTADTALSDAARVDQAIADGRDPGPMAGATATIKVNVDQEGRATTNGLRLQKDLVAETDSPVVANLRAAGASLIGRTNVPAFSLRWFCRNPLHGHTKNPRNPGLTPGGSSGGAAAAVAAGIGAIGHGTDIAGSIRYPAYACGVHGIRPSLGRLPAMNFTGPDRTIGPQLMAVSGPIARTIEDLKLSLTAMAAPDPRDPWSLPHAPTFEARADQAKRAAVTLAPDGLSVDPRVAETVRDGAERLRAAGWEVVEVDCPPLREAAALQAILWTGEFRMGAEKMVAEEADPDSVFILEQMYARAPAPDYEGLMTLFRRRAALMREWRLFLTKHPVWLCPVSAEPPFADLADLESPERFAEIMEAQLLQIALPFLSLPSLTVSTRVEGDLPLGVQLISDQHGEAALFAAGAAIEAAGTPESPIDPASAA